MGENAPKVTDGIVETERDEVLVSPLEVPFEEKDPNGFKRERIPYDYPGGKGARSIFPRQG